MRPVFVTVLAIETKIHEVRAGHQKTTARDQHAVQDDREIFGERNAHHQQRQSGQRQPKRQRSMMPAITIDQRKQRQRAGKQHETALETVIGEKRQPQQGQDGQYDGKGGAMDCTEEGGGGAEAIGQVPPAGCLRYWRGIHGEGLHQARGAGGPARELIQYNTRDTHASDTLRTPSDICGVHPNRLRNLFPMHHRLLHVLALFVLVLLVSAPALAASTEHVVELPLPDGSQQRLLYLAPAHPKASIVMLPGGAGDVGIRRDGDLRHDDNFVVRTRALWADRGYAVVIPDAIDGGNLRGMRSSPAYAALVAALLDFAHRQSVGPVFLLGTSQGSIAAMNGAAHLDPSRLAGLVLTESVSVLGGSHETVFMADPKNVRVPVLVVANRDDQCKVAPPGNAPRIAAAMSSSPAVKVMYVNGGTQHSANTCGSLTPHGYYGIENTVVGDIAGWMDQQLSP